MNYLGKNDVAIVREGGNAARIIRQTSYESGPVSYRVVLTETRDTDEEMDWDMPVCWTIVTRVYWLDANGWEEIDKIERYHYDALTLEKAWGEAIDLAQEMAQGAREWAACDDCEEVSK